MKYIFRVLPAALLLCTAAAAQTGIPKTSPLTKIYLGKVAATRDGIVPGYVYKEFGGRHYISAIIKVGTAFSEETLQPLDVRIGTKAGNIWTAQVPVENVRAFTALPGLEYVQLDEPVNATLDSARRATHVDSVQTGIGFATPFLGKNVVVGIVDAGFDFTSPVLWDTSGSRFRVKKIWAQKATGGTPPANFIYGKEITDSTAMWSLGTDQNSMSHGTHVTGIAAGSGWGSTNGAKYRGMAPASDIVLVGIMPAQQNWINTGGSDILDGVNYVYQYATAVHKPAVVNLSWGASIGPHDGTSLFNQALDNLTGPGKIFVTSAGNEGDTKVHLRKTFTTADTMLNTFIVASSVKKTWVDIWGDTSKPFCVKFRLISGGITGDSTGFICMDNQVHNIALQSANGDTCFLTIVPTASEFNHKPRVFINVWTRAFEGLCMTVKGTGGTIDMWNYYVEAPNGYYSPFTNGGYTWATAGDTLQSITDNASGKSVITVGAYASKTSWQNIGGSTISYTSGTQVGGIAPFSSVGPTEEGRMKPEISAPGYGVASIVNSFDGTYIPGGSSYTNSVVDAYHSAQSNRDYRFAVLAGTSMSSPAAAGIIALMLEANPGLAPWMVRDILAQTAIHDNFTGAGSNNTFGAGKINAYQAVKMSMQYTGVGGVARNALACTAYPNPATASFRISYLGEKAGTLNVVVYDLTGRAIRQFAWIVQSGYNTLPVQMRDMPAGAYLVRVTDAAGAASTLRVVMQ